MALGFGFFAQVSLAQLETIQPEPVHSKILKAITQSLNFEHFKQMNLDDQFSSVLFEQYLERLDPLKLHFSAQDIQKLKRFRNTMDDVLKTGNLQAPYIIHNTYLDRAEVRFQYMLEKLKSKNFLVFANKDTFEVDREDAPWPENQQALEQLWEKQLKEAALRLLLTDKPLDEVKGILKKRYEAKINQLAQVTSEDVFESFMNSVTELYDPHTQYLSPRASDNFNINMSLSLEGIGAVLQTEDEHTKVVRLVAGGPADQSGQLKPLDKIVAVGTDPAELVDIVGWRIDDVVSRIRGPKGTNVYLEVLSASAQHKSTKVIKITRNTVKLEDQAARSDVLQVQRHNRKYKLGVIEIPAFYADFSGRSKGDPNYRRVSDDVEKILNTRKIQKTDGLVIDLRANGGGSLQEANRLLGLFLKTGPTVQIKNTRQQVSLSRDSDPKLAYDKPIVVLIDRLSASASEIFAGAVQDYQRGLILGSRSFGKGTVQVLRPLDHGQLKMTHAKFYRISGGSNQHKGIIPDLEMVSMFDPEDVGESALDNALPWDTIKPAQFKPYYTLSPLLPVLQERHQQRIKSDVDYQFLVSQAQLLDDIRDDTLLVLNKDERELEQKQLQEKRLAIANTRREAKGLDALASYEDLKAFESEKEEKAAKTVLDEDDAVLFEAGDVLADLIDFQRDNQLVSNTDTEHDSTLFDFFGEILK